MLRLDLNRKARWLDLGHGVRLEVEPLTTGVMAAARRDPSVSAIFKESRSAADPANEASDEDMVARDEVGIAMAKAVAQRVVIGWEGVGDAEGNPVDVTPEGINALLDVFVIFDAFQSRYLASGFLMESEKNGSALSLNGTSAGATGTAKPAKARARIARKR